MKKSTLITLLFFVLSSFAFSQGEWIEINWNEFKTERTGRIIDNNGTPYAIQSGSNLEGGNFDGMDLSFTQLVNAKCRGASFKNANLRNAYMFYADLRNANLEGANLSSASFSGGANMQEANLKNTTWANAAIDNRMIFKDAILDGANFTFCRELLMQSKFLEQFDQKTISKLSTAAREDELDALAEDVATQFESLGQNDIAIGEQLTALGQNDTAIGEQMTKLGQNDESIMAEINAMKAQLQTLVASIAEKDAEIVELKKRPTLEQVRDARAGSVVLTVEPDGNNITLGLTIEQSDNLTQWTKLDGEMSRTIPIPEGKKFYRFALDK